MNDTGLPDAPAGYKWKIRRWGFWDNEVFPYPRFGKLAVVLVSDGYYDFWEKHKARALMSPRSIRAAAFRILARHRRAELRSQKASLRANRPGAAEKLEAIANREKAREARRDAQVVGYAGTYPPKKLGR